MKKSLKLSAVFILILVLITGCSANNGGSGNSDGGAGDKGTITFGLTPWTSTIPPTYVAKQLLEEMGYKIKLQNADAGGVYTGLAGGDTDVFMDAWLPDLHRNYMEKYGDKIVDTAISYPNGELGWVIPAYVDNINSIEDIKGNEALFEGKFFGIEEGAGMSLTTNEMIKDYGLDLEYVASSEAGMLAQAKRYIAQKKPIIFLGWRPHPMFVEWDLKILDDPKKFFKTSEVHVMTRKGLQDDAPEAYQFLSNWSIPVEDIEQMIVEINGGKKEEEVAKNWIDNNQDKVNKMLGK